MLNHTDIGAGRTTTKVRKVDFSPDEFIAGVVGMTPAEVGIYWLVCSLIYSSGGAIPRDDERLRAIRCDPRSTRSVIAALIAKGKIELGTGGDMMVSRCRKELENAKRRIQQSLEAASRGGRLASGSQENQPLKQKSAADGEKPSPSPSPSTPQSSPLKSPRRPPKGPAYSEDFLAFWQLYPHKVGKDAAWKAWEKRTDRPERAVLATAVQNYIATKPAERDFCNPSTWINQGRWNDVPAEAMTGHGRTEIPPCPPNEDKVAWYLKHAGAVPQ